MKTKLKLLGIIGIITLSIVWLPDVMASDKVATSMFVSPVVQKITLVPGETYEGSIEVSNSNLAIYDLQYKVEVGSYQQGRDEEKGDDYGAIDTSGRSTHNLIMDGITLENETGFIEPNGTKRVNYTIDVPKDAPAGSQYATLLVNDETETNHSNTGNIAITNRLQIGVSLFANVAGATIDTGEVLESNIPSFLTTGPLETTSLVKNTGNVYTDASYILQVWPLFSNEEICTNEENPSTSLVLPDTERFHAEQCSLPFAGIFRAKQTVKIFNEVSETERWIVVCPLWLMFIIAFIIIALIIWLVLRMRSHKGGKGRRASAAE